MKTAVRGMVALAGLAVCGVAQASNWVDTGARDSHDGRYSIDTTSIRIESDGVVRAWFQAEYNTTRTVNGKQFTSKTFMDRFNCKAGTVSFGPITAYDSAGRSVESRNTYMPPEDVAPDTVVERLMKVACSSSTARAN